jgi:hypothetical protein
MVDHNIARAASDPESEVFWTQIYFVLATLALNAMVEPTGRVCGLPPTLQVFLRSSPVVCAADLLAVCLRFVAYSVRGMSPAAAARRIVARRHDQPPAQEEPAPPDNSDGNSVAELCLLFGRIFCRLGVLLQAVKLFAYKGLPYSQAWGTIYLVCFVVTKMLGWVHAAAVAAPGAVLQDQRPGDDTLEGWLRFGEQSLGTAAVLLQLGLLGWVDLMLTPREVKPLRSMGFVVLRVSAHIVAGFVDVAVVTSMSVGPVRLAAHRQTIFIFSIFVVFSLLLVLHQLGLRFSLMYFISSFIISSMTWVLYSDERTRRRVLLCKAGGRDQLNVLAFDFFCRILGFSLYWYAGHYSSSGTSQPSWAKNLP